MPAYSYEAVDAGGKTLKGTLEGDTHKAIRSQLRAQALIPVKVDLIQGQSRGDAPAGHGSLGRFRKRAFSASELTIWTRQMAGLVGSGLPLERALSALMEESDDATRQALVSTLRAEVNSGTTFSQALSNHPREFNETYVSVIHAGEQSGALGMVLERLADDMEAAQQLRAKLIAAALYPAIVSLVAVAIVVFRVTYVVPQVATVFAGTHRTLPWLTVVMLTLSGFLRQWGWLLSLLLALVGVAGARILRIEAIRLRFDALWLTLPLLGPLARGYNAARFAGTLSMLVNAGVPILKALQTAASTLSNAAMRADALDALVLVREGAPLASAMQLKKRFPSLVTMFARLGEQTGTLPLMLQRAATQLSADVQRRAMQFATLLEPLLIVTMGLVVMLIVLSVMLPIIQLNQFAK